MIGVPAWSFAGIMLAAQRIEAMLMKSALLAICRPKQILGFFDPCSIQSKRGKDAITLPRSKPLRRTDAAVVSREEKQNIRFNVHRIRALTIVHVKLNNRYYEENTGTGSPSESQAEDQRTVVCNEKTRTVLCIC
jgi:hypothetical protein